MIKTLARRQVEDGRMVVRDCTGEPDVNIFVVQSGRLDVTTTDAQGITHYVTLWTNARKWWAWKRKHCIFVYSKTCVGTDPDPAF
jgi:hypothetical protein